MATIKSYTDIEQSSKLAEILPLESADMTLPFRHPKNDEYIPGYVVSRNYVEVYNEMMKLPAMEKEDVCKLIQPSWSLAALLEQLHYEVCDDGGYSTYLQINKDDDMYQLIYEDPSEILESIETDRYEHFVDACVDMIIKLHKLDLL